MIFFVSYYAFSLNQSKLFINNFFSGNMYLSLGIFINFSLDFQSFGNSGAVAAHAEADFEYFVLSNANPCNFV